MPDYSLFALSCRDNFSVCVYEPAHQHCEALRHHFISWSCDCHTFVNPLHKRNIGTRVSVIVIVERDAFFSLETTTFTKDYTLLNCYKLTTAATKKSVHPIASHKQRVFAEEMVKNTFAHRKTVNNTFAYSAFS